MNTILSYLENMFLHLPQTPDVLRAKQELASMMEDKYNELLTEGKKENEAVGIVISEFGNLDELAEELGLGNVMQQNAQPDENLRRVSRREAEEYIEVSKKTSKLVSFGVMLCIYSPLALLYIGGLQDQNPAITDAQVTMIGMIPLLVLVAIAVTIFIYNGAKMEKFEYLKKERIQIDSSLEIYLQELKERLKPSVTVKVMIGVAICILSVIPLLVVGSIWDDNDMYEIYSLMFLIVMIGIAIWFFIAGGSTNECIKVLCQEDDFSKEGKKNAKIMEVIGGIYWPIITVIYLVWSFTTMAWGFTWIVWPIAGIIFGGIAAICAVVTQSVIKES